MWLALWLQKKVPCQIRVFAYIKADDIRKLSEENRWEGGAEFWILNLVGITKPHPYIHCRYLETPVKENNRWAQIQMNQINEQLHDISYASHKPAYLYACWATGSFRNLIIAGRSVMINCLDKCSVQLCVWQVEIESALLLFHIFLDESVPKDDQQVWKYSSDS